MSCAMFAWLSASERPFRGALGLPACWSWKVWKVLLWLVSRSVGTLLLSFIFLLIDGMPAVCVLAAPPLELANWKYPTNFLGGFV